MSIEGETETHDYRGRPWSWICAECSRVYQMAPERGATCTHCGELHSIERIFQITPPLLDISGSSVGSRSRLEVTTFKNDYHDEVVLTIHGLRRHPYHWKAIALTPELSRKLRALLDDYDAGKLGGRR